VQGQLRNEYLTVTIETVCSHCGQPMKMEVDSDLSYRLADKSARPLVFTPDVDWLNFHQPNIIDGY